MELSGRTLTILVLAALALSALSLVLSALSAGRRRRREPGDPLRLDEALRGILDGQAKSIKRLEAAVRSLHATDQRQDALIQGAIRRVGLLRYDAFEDVGGRLSFSCAFLDDRGDGVVLTSINGRQDTRVYSKPVLGGRSSYNLSAEEEEAIRQALSEPADAVGAS